MYCKSYFYRIKYRIECDRSKKQSSAVENHGSWLVKFIGAQRKEGDDVKEKSEWTR